MIPFGLPMAKDRLSGTLAVILLADAEWVADIVQILNPDFTVENLRSAVPIKDPKHLETFLGALRTAGLSG